LETYVRKAYFEFFVNDPAFVGESLLIYNPRHMTVVFTGYLSSLVRITATQVIGIFMAGLILAGILAADAEQRRLFRHGALLVTGGFLVSLSPILLTVSNYPTMGDQYFALLVVFGCWCVLALATGLAMLLSQRREPMDNALHAP
jgi:hypothetical protein